MRLAAVASLILLCWCSGNSHASQTIAFPMDYELPPADSLPRLERYVDRAEYEAARGATDWRMTQISYASGSLTLSAYLAQAEPPLPHAPLVLFGRGSYVVSDMGWQIAPMLRRLTRAGYAVVVPLLRGSRGAAGHDEMGGADLEDFRLAVSAARENGATDSRELYLYGESRGGVMVLQALRDGIGARAAVTFGAFTDLDSLLAADPDRSGRMPPVVWPGWPAGRDTIAHRRSAMRWAGEIRTPLLLLHGTDDTQVPPRQAVALHERLRALGRPADLRLISGASHTLREVAAARDSLAVDWFRLHAPAFGR